MLARRLIVGENQRNSRESIIELYNTMLKHYDEKGVGATSELYNTVITQGLIDTVRKRYDQLRKRTLIKR